MTHRWLNCEITLNAGGGALSNCPGLLDGPYKMRREGGGGVRGE